MLPLTIYLAKLFGLYFIVISGNDGEDGLIQAEPYRHRRCIYEKRTAYSLQRRRYRHRRPGARNRPQHLVGWRASNLVTILGWMILISGLAYLSISHDRRLQLYQAVHWEKSIFVMMGITLVVGPYVAVAAFSA